MAERRKRKMIIVDADKDGKPLPPPDPRITRELPAQLTYEPPRSVEALLQGGPSPLGNSMISEYLSCPERSRLRALGVRRRRSFESDVIEPLDYLGFGSLIHALLAYRIVAGQEAMEALLAGFEGLHPDDQQKALNCMRVYDLTYRPGTEPFQYIAVEPTVYTDIGDGRGGELVRTVRYDAIVRPYEPRQVDGQVQFFPSDGVLSLEHKTSARGGSSAMTSYWSQFLLQQTIWNANTALVAKYGPMLGVIPDVMVKTIVPAVERIGPLYFSKLQEQRAKEYARLPSSVQYPVMPDGSYPRMLHGCWSRYGPCPYTGLCWDDEQGNYTFPGEA